MRAHALAASAGLLLLGAAGGAAPGTAPPASATNATVVTQTLRGVVWRGNVVVQHVPLVARLIDANGDGFIDWIRVEGDAAVGADGDYTVRAAFKGHLDRNLSYVPGWPPDSARAHAVGRPRSDEWTVRPDARHRIRFVADFDGDLVRTTPEWSTGPAWITVSFALEGSAFPHGYSPADSRWLEAPISLPDVGHFGRCAAYRRDVTWSVGADGRVDIDVSLDVLRNEPFTLAAVARWYGVDSAGTPRSYRGRDSVTVRRPPGATRVHLRVEPRTWRDGRAVGRIGHAQHVFVQLCGPGARDDCWYSEPTDFRD